MTARANQKRLSAEARHRVLRAVLERSDSIWLVLEADGLVFDASDRVASLLGASPQALAGRAFSTLRPLVDGSVVAPWTWPRLGDTEHRVTLHGELGPVELSVRASTLELPELPGPTPLRLGLVGQLVAPPPRRHDPFFTESPVATFVEDTRGHLLEVNRAWQALLGREPREVIGQRLEDLLEPESRSRLQQARSRGGAATALVDLELRLQDSRDTLIDVLLTARPASDGEVVGFLVDVTEHRRLGEELRRAREDAEAASRAKSAFLGNMSHELRTPLNGILGYAQLLERHPTLAPEQRRGIEAIRRSGEHLLTLINDVLDLARIESNAHGLSREPFDLLEFLGEVGGQAHVRAEQRGLSFVLDLDPRLPRRVHGDVRKLRHVLLNLLGNAVKFTVKGGVTLRVSAPEASERLRFEVLDTGVGIAPEQLGRVFQPFEQGRVPPTSAASQGTGLGLAIVRELATLMGTRVEVESARGAGSRFWFDLALPPAELPSGTPELAVIPRRIGYPGARRRVLVVDDQWENRTIVRAMLEPLGFEVSEAEDGETALAAITGSPRPDVVLLDLTMPEAANATMTERLAGLSVARRVRSDEALAAVRLVALSGRVAPEERALSAEAGCDAFVAKPIRMDELLDTLGQALSLTWLTDHPEPPQETPPSAPELETGEFDPSDELELSRAELETLRRLANEGRIVEVREELSRLEALCATAHGQCYAAFVRRLGRFVRHFQLEELVAFIDANSR